MSFHEYIQSQTIELQNYPFYALIMAAMRQADTDNTLLLRACWPEVWSELENRYHSPGGELPND